MVLFLVPFEDITICAFVDCLSRIFGNSELWSGAAGVYMGACILSYWQARTRRIERAGVLVAIHVEFERVFANT